MSGLYPWLGRIVAMTSAATRRNAIAQFAPLGLRMQDSGGLPWRHPSMLVDQFEGWPR